MKDKTISDAVMRLLGERSLEATICPSEVARALSGETEDWRAMMPEVRRVAGLLAEKGQLRVTRKGIEVDALSKGGPIRLGRV